MGAYSRGGLIRGGGLISKFYIIFLKGRHNNDITSQRNKLKNNKKCEDLTNIVSFYHQKSRVFLLFGLQSKEVILYCYCPVILYWGFLEIIYYSVIVLPLNKPPWGLRGAYGIRGFTV